MFRRLNFCLNHNAVIKSAGSFNRRKRKEKEVMKTLWCFVVSLVLISNGPAVAPADCQIQAQNSSPPSSIDVPAVEHYKLALAIDPQHHSLTGQADIGLRNSSTHALAVIPILLYRLMDVEVVSDVNGKAIPFTQSVVKFP